MDVVAVDEPTLRKKRRQEYAREYYRRTHPFAPIFKGDIRRHLGMMWGQCLELWGFYELEKLSGSFLSEWL